MRPQVPYSSGVKVLVMINVKITPKIIDKIPPTNEINPV